ncbi:MAG: hypothetical protein R6X25_05015 [Candidatus Krumholzibacteriia bacterium]
METRHEHGRARPAARTCRRSRAVGCATRLAGGKAAIAAVLLAAGIVAATPIAARDWNRTQDPMQGGIGVHAGKIGGTGLSIKVPLQWWLYVQGTGAVWNTSDHRRHNLGVEGQYLLRQDRTMRLFLAAGLSRYYHRERHDDRPDEVAEHWNYGFGVGTEFLAGERWSFQVELDFTHEGDDDDFLLFPQVGFFFYW